MIWVAAAFPLELFILQHCCLYVLLSVPSFMIRKFLKKENKSLTTTGPGKGAQPQIRARLSQQEKILGTMLCQDVKIGKKLGRFGKAKEEGSLQTPGLGSCGRLTLSMRPSWVLVRPFAPSIFLQWEERANLAVAQSRAGRKVGGSAPAPLTHFPEAPSRGPEIRLASG